MAATSGLVSTWVGGPHGTSTIRVQYLNDGSLRGTYVIPTPSPMASDGDGVGAHTPDLFGGFEVRFLGCGRFKGHYFDPRLGAADSDKGCTISIVVSSARSEITATYRLPKRGDGGEAGTWTAVRASCPRNANGRIDSFAMREPAIFERLTKSHTPASRAAHDEAEREVLLAASLHSTAAMGEADKQCVKFHASGAAGAYIPPLAAAGSPFDDTVQTRHQQHSRHKGKQLVVNPSPSSAPVTAWMDCPYEDRYTVGRRLKREQRAHLEGCTSKALLTRQPFGAVSEEVWMGRGGDAAPRRDLTLTLSAVDADVDEASLRAAATAARQPQQAQPAPGASCKSGASSGKLTRGPDGRMSMNWGPRNFAVGALPVGLLAPFQHLPDPYVSAWEVGLKQARGSEHATAAAAAAAEGGAAVSARAPPFKPVGPTITLSKLPSTAEPAEGPVTGTSRVANATATTAEGDAAPAAGASRPIYKPYSKDLCRFERFNLSSLPYVSDPLPGGAAKGASGARDGGPAEPDKSGVLWKLIGTPRLRYRASPSVAMLNL